MHIKCCKKSVRSQFSHAANGNIKKKVIAFYLTKDYSPFF